MKPLTKQYIMARLRNHVEPLLDRRRASEITSGDTEKFVADVTAGGTAKDEKVGPRKRLIVRGGDGAARKVVRDPSAVFSFGGRHGFVAKNPVEDASVRKTDYRRERFLTLAEVSRLGAPAPRISRSRSSTNARRSPPTMVSRRARRRWRAARPCWRRRDQNSSARCCATWSAARRPKLISRRRFFEPQPRRRRSEVAAAHRLRASQSL